MKRPRPWDNLVDVIQSEESSSSDVEVENFLSTSKPLPINSTIEMPVRQLSSEGTPMSSVEVEVIIYL